MEPQIFCGTHVLFFRARHEKISEVFVFWPCREFIFPDFFGRMKKSGSIVVRYWSNIALRFNFAFSTRGNIENLWVTDFFPTLPKCRLIIFKRQVPKMVKFSARWVNHSRNAYIWHSTNNISNNWGYICVRISVRNDICVKFCCYFGFIRLEML